jgi:hypothetical protein
LGHDYRDTGKVRDPSDQFLAWINIPGSGIRNMGGIRPLKFTRLGVRPPAYVVLVSDERSRGSASNPWEDLVDQQHGRIVYWGDAKFDVRRTVAQFVGNRALLAAYDELLDDHRTLIPPFLHFSKTRTGVMRFNGLCALERLDLTWFEDQGRPVRNYRAHLAILSEEFVDLDWLHRRATADSLGDLVGGPPAWRRYQAGVLDRLQVWTRSLKTPLDQLPAAGSSDAMILDQLVALKPTEFEAAVVSVFRKLDDVRHSVTRTRPTGDGGFDFYGKFTLPPPVHYEIDFLGEVKRYSRRAAVRPKDVSRLVARLGRGQYGIFVTTSYFTRQAQEEVIQDAYPTALIAGSDLVRMMRELRIATTGGISPKWMDVVRSEYATGLDVPLRAVAESVADYGDDATAEPQIVPETDPP